MQSVRSLWETCEQGNPAPQCLWEKRLQFSDEAVRNLWKYFDADVDDKDDDDADDAADVPAASAS